MLGRKRRPIEEEWPYPVPNAAIRYRRASPNSPSTETFDCGAEWWAEEINVFVRKAEWANKPFESLEFGLNRKSVGFAFLVVSRQRYPDSESEQKAPYELVIMAGISLQFQGQVDPGSSSGEHLSDTMFRAIEMIARQAEEPVVGLYLHVREPNTRARAFYERFGFVVDQAKGVFMSGRDPKPTLEMRKDFPSETTDTSSELVAYRSKSSYGSPS